MRRVVCRRDCIHPVSSHARIAVDAFCSLSGNFPFDGYDQVLYTNIMNGNFSFNSAVWNGISNTAKDFIRCLLVVDPAKRLTALQALNHAWMQEEHTDSRDLRMSIDQLRQRPIGVW